MENIGISHQQFVEYIGLRKIFGKKISHLQFVEYLEVLHKLQLAKKFEIFFSQLQLVENIGISYQQFVEYKGLRKIFWKKISHLQFADSN